MVSFQRTRLGRLPALVVLVIYGGSAVLGYGLHSLVHVHHGHGHLSQASACNCCHHAHCGTPLGSHRTAALYASEAPCSICEFLAQAQSPAVEIVETELITKLSTEIPVSEHLEPLFIPADHLARGPPAC